MNINRYSVLLRTLTIVFLSLIGLVTMMGCSVGGGSMMFKEDYNKDKDGFVWSIGAESPKLLDRLDMKIDFMSRQLPRFSEVATSSLTSLAISARYLPLSFKQETIFVPIVGGGYGQYHIDKTYVNEVGRWYVTPGQSYGVYYSETIGKIYAPHVLVSVYILPFGLTGSPKWGFQVEMRYSFVKFQNAIGSPDFSAMSIMVGLVSIPTKWEMP